MVGLDSELFRRLVFVSMHCQDPNLNALASRHFRNHDGVVKVSRPSGDGHICEVALQAKQVRREKDSYSKYRRQEARARPRMLLFAIWRLRCCIYM